MVAGPIAIVDVMVSVPLSVMGFGSKHRLAEMVFREISALEANREICTCWFYVV
jgi:hypothetical protein